MTNEQAIEVINGHIKDSSIAYGTFTGQALRMAIEALKAQLSQEGTTKGTTTDTISRQAAKEAYCKHFCHRGMACPDNLCKEVNEAFDELPSAQPERKKGKWIYNSPVTMKCDQCGLVIKDWDWHRFKFCPNCGADMRGKKDE